jgi:hypothetical protein
MIVALAGLPPSEWLDPKSIEASFRLDRKHPKRQDRAERDQTAYGPTHGVDRFIIVRAAHRVRSGCRLSPVRHDSLVKSYLGSMQRCACISN